MPDVEKVIKGLECRAEDNDFPCFLCAYYKPDEKPVARCDYRGLMNDAIALLKKQEAQKFFVDESGKITPLPVVFPNRLMNDLVEVVRCKDCKHRPKEPNIETYESGFDLEFPEGSKCPCRCSGDEWYSWYPDDEWFCADGEHK